MRKRTCEVEEKPSCFQLCDGAWERSWASKLLSKRGLADAAAKESTEKSAQGSELLLFDAYAKK